MLDHLAIQRAAVRAFFGPGMRIPLNQLVITGALALWLLLPSATSAQPAGATINMKYHGDVGGVGMSGVIVVH